MDAVWSGRGAPVPGFRELPPAVLKPPTQAVRGISSQPSKQQPTKSTERDSGKARELVERVREERDKEELTSSLRELTRYVQVADAMRSLDTVCKDLKSAIKKLEKLFSKLKVSQVLCAKEVL